MSEYTPGPWRYREGALVIFPNNAGGFCICNCPDAEANARLVAAAPDLLEALERIAEVCNGYDLEAGWACKHARAAIAKATQS